MKFQKNVQRKVNVLNASMNNKTIILEDKPSSSFGRKMKKAKAKSTNKIQVVISNDKY